MVQFRDPFISICLSIFFSFKMTFTSSVTMTEDPITLKNFIIAAGYPLNGGPPVEEDALYPMNITVDIQLMSINEVAPHRMEFEVDFVIILDWQDDFVEPLGNRDNKWVYVDNEDASQIWKPTIFYRNCKACQPEDFRNNISSFQWNSYLLKIRTALRSVMKFTCAMDLSHYPLDVQTCSIEIQSYEDEANRIYLRPYIPHPSEKRTLVATNTTISDYIIKGQHMGDCTSRVNGRVLSCVIASVELKRYFGHSGTMFYAPTFLIVILSWISFWYPISAFATRVTLEVTLMLSLAMWCNQSQKTLPIVSYVTAFDVWIFVCFFFVFAALIEYSIAHYWWREKKKIGPRTRTIKQVAPTEILRERSAPPNPMEKIFLDEISRVCFPAMFFLFNIVYWNMYTI